MSCNIVGLLEEKNNQYKKLDNKKIQVVKKFHHYEMDENWQRIGEITSENLETFIAVSNAKIKLYNSIKHTTHEYVFRKNSQISIQNNHMEFGNNDVTNLTVETTQ